MKKGLRNKEKRLRDRILITIDSKTSISTFKKLEFLNLEYDEKLNNNTISLDNYKVGCKFNNKFKHSLHTDNIHLNGVTDLIINLGISLEKQSTNTVNILERLSKYIYKTENSIRILENLAYIKEQNNLIIKELKHIRKSIPNKQEIQQLSNLLENNKPTATINKIEKQFANQVELLETIKKIVEG